MKRLWVFLLSAVMVFSLAACGGASSGASSESPGSSEGSVESSTGIKIGFTDNYNGNSYHQTMEKSMQEAADDLKSQGYLSELTIVEANQDAATQIQQIQDFIMQDYDVIVVDPCSTSSLNSAIEEACNAGIPVLVINDGPVDLENNMLYQLNFDFVDLAETLTEAVCDQIGGKGSIIELRGTAGTTCDTDMHQGVLNALEKYPDVKIVGEIYTDWTGSKAQSELNSILPTLDKVDGLVTQGGDAFAAAQAFVSAGYTEMPVIAGDNRGSFLNWWAGQEGYKTLSGACNPWDGAIAMYIAVDIANGEKVANEMNCPFGYVTADNLVDYKGMPDDDVATITYDWETIKTEIETGK